ncbi:hypothetical protein HanIR_Chr07g0306241 [Helianthus annuus]|nr:hypothetical protein HanIR_Chr07g0306241 [Helianthus annuus]
MLGGHTLFCIFNGLHCFTFFQIFQRRYASVQRLIKIVHLYHQGSQLVRILQKITD